MILMMRFSDDIYIYIYIYTVVLKSLSPVDFSPPIYYK